MDSAIPVAVGLGALGLGFVGAVTALVLAKNARENSYQKPLSNEEKWAAILGPTPVEDDPWKRILTKAEQIGAAVSAFPSEFHMNDSWEDTLFRINPRTSYVSYSAAGPVVYLDLEYRYPNGRWAHSEFATAEQLRERGVV